MLRQPDPAVGAHGEAGDAQTVDVGSLDAGLRNERTQCPPDPPLRTLDGVAHIGNCDGRRNHDAVVWCAQGIGHQPPASFIVSDYRELHGNIAAGCIGIGAALVRACDDLLGHRPLDTGQIDLQFDGERISDGNRTHRNLRGH